MAINKTGTKRGALISKHQKAGDGWEDLAATVNEQAAKDYKWFLNHPGKCLQTDGKAETKQTLEAFFRSEWFGTLCTIAGAELAADDVLKNIEKNKDKQHRRKCPKGVEND